MNKSPITIVGNVTRDPEIVTLASGTKKAAFSVAVPHRYKKNDEWVEDTSFLNVIAWSWLAEEVDRVVLKGSKVILSGRLVHRTYDNDDGEKRYITEVVAETIGLDVVGVQDYEKKVRGDSNDSSSSSSSSSKSSASSSAEALPDELW